MHAQSIVFQLRLQKLSFCSWHGWKICAIFFDYVISLSNVQFGVQWPFEPELHWIEPRTKFSSGFREIAWTELRFSLGFSKNTLRTKLNQVWPSLFQPTMQPECTHKSWDKPKSYASNLGPTAPWKALATSAISFKSQKQKNLTINDWLTISTFIDTLPSISQTSVCNHFQSLTDGALEFNQTTLSQKLKKQEKIEAHAASTKCQCIVTHPEVDQALYLWLKSMKAKNEVVTGNMLCTKQRFFEQELRVPEEAQLQGEGWLASFKKVWVRGLLIRLWLIKQ